MSGILASSAAISPGEWATRWPSGVESLTPHQLRSRVLANGWGALPILAHDAPGKAAGKRPALKAWADFAGFEAARPAQSAVASWDRQFSRAPGTGIPCGTVVGIDVDVTDPILAAEIEAVARACLGDTPFSRQGKAPKLLLVYRAAEAFPKRAFKANDGSGAGLDILADGSQFVGFGIHPGTGRPYRWIGPESPLTAGPDAAPEVTAAQIKAFVDRVHALMPLSKTGGRQARGPGGESAEIVRDAEGFVIDGREAWLTNLVWRAANELHDGGLPLTEEAVADLAWGRFLASARPDVGGRVWARADAAAKARGTLDRIRRRKVSLGPKIVATDPTYPDEARPLAEAEAEVRRLIEDFFTHEAPGFKNALGAYLIEHEGNPLRLPPKPRGTALRIEAGIGKTEVAIEAAAKSVRRGLAVVYAVPTVKLGDEVASRFAARGIDAQVYRGRDREDPEGAGEAMCRNLPAVRDAERAKVWSVYAAACETKPKGTSAAIRCPMFDACGYVRQRRAEPAVWIVPHVMLFRDRPALIPAPDALVIDEGFASGAVPNKPTRLTLDAIEAAALPDGGEDAVTLDRLRACLVGVLRTMPDGPLTRAAMAGAGLTANDAREAHRLEWRRRLDPELHPGLDASERSRRAERAAAVNREVSALTSVWRGLTDFLDGEAEASGRMLLRRDDASKARCIEHRALKPVHEKWHAPTLILDATAPPADVLARALGMPVDLKASISAVWSPYGRVRQIIGAPVSSTKLGLTEREGNRRAIGDLRRLVVLRAALAFPRTVAVIAQEDAITLLEHAGLPKNVETGHFNALAGLDRWREAAGLIVIGRTLPPPMAMEIDAGVLIGEPAQATVTEDGRKAFFDRVEGGIRLRNGGAVAVERYQHPDPVAEALRWQTCEANVIQAVGRLRPLRRGADAPFFLDILCDVPLPFAVDGVETWEDARPGSWSIMASEGVILTGAGDIEAAFPEDAPSRKAARGMETEPTVALTSIRSLSIDVGATVSRVTYKRRGRYPDSAALILPNGPKGKPALKRWFDEHGMPLEHVVRDGGEPSAFERVGRVLFQTKFFLPDGIGRAVLTLLENVTTL
ncbi:hypothetical protein GOFOIKOB_4884 [Methylobacterium tardum]|uniref:bifunctional DNA primase/polymerase n=1 Tax=Methylobacterium tardum TaxID=374432 RepID=UPI001EDE5FB5|nr:bifunctional DNA primase/polymerase [Methylobacterium tardum]URD35815.1 bifunctional DNA primase/polymerase [Methylobacterium tardum]GJE51820.1 hypothetical protein GOFOIKOB_4884 [Methylobacterium tardum]